MFALYIRVESLQVITIKNLNTYHAVGVSRRHIENVAKCLKNVIMLEFHDYIWNHHMKCIQISTNMPGIGSVIHEIAIEMLKINTILRVKPHGRVQCVKVQWWHIFLRGE